MTLFSRSSGVLLHPTSLPGRYGIGDLGDSAYRFVDWLYDAGQSIWQILPIGPTSYGDSPYQTLSAFAGNPNLISLDKLVDEGYLTNDDLADTPTFPNDNVDFGWVIGWHDTKLELAYARFKTHATIEARTAFNLWCADNAYWLEPFALFVALKKFYGGNPWVEWAEELVQYQKEAIEKARLEHADQVNEQRFRQWLFFTQWFELKSYANNKGVRFFGDIPIFVAHDSSDVWGNQEDYFLDSKGYPTVIAGVPPDYFSPTGQRWGNPLYRWDIMKSKNYAWWISRFKSSFSTVDYIRVDHFRGFEANWEIPATEETAINGRWVAGPNADLFEVVQAALGSLPIIAEDLGVITEGVEKLRDGFGLPGMKVLQFAWSDPTNAFLPHNHPVNCVVYTGTHDNNTTLGWWYEETNDSTRDLINDYIGRRTGEVAWDLIRLGMASAAHTAIFPLQDLLQKDSSARMNTPGKQGGNWTWRFLPHELTEDVKNRLAHLTWLYQRRPDQQDKVYGDTAMKV